MPLKFEPYTGPAETPKYDYQRYPLNLHRGVPPNHQTRVAHSPEDEEAALAAGWSTEAPKLPDPAPEFAAPKSTEERLNWLQAEVQTLGDRVDELQERMLQWMEAKRRAPRPVKPEADKVEAASGASGDGL